MNACQIRQTQMLDPRKINYGHDSQTVCDVGVDDIMGVVVVAAVVAPLVVVVLSGFLLLLIVVVMMMLMMIMMMIRIIIHLLQITYT